MDHGFFSMAFDFDHDGHLDTFERAADFSMFMGIMEDNALPNSGLDPIDLEFVDEWERREALEDAGLDLNDYDF